MIYMKKKKGFTLVELLAVIAILAVLVLFAMPNIIALFQDSKKNAFMTEAKIIYQTAIAQNLFNTTGEEAVYNTGDLPISGGQNLEYSVLANKAGQIVCFQVANDEYMWIYRNKGQALTHEDDIAREEELAERDFDIILDCTGATSLFDTTIPATLAHGGTWWEGETDKSTIERIIITYSYRSDDYDETFYSDEEKVGGLTTFVKDDVAYLVINRNKRKTKSIRMPANAADTFSGFENLKNITGLKLLDFSAVTNMDNFFGKVIDGELVSSPNLSYINGYETFNTSNVVSAKYAFAVSNWNVGSLQDATGMFYKTKASMINLSGWNVRNVANYNQMFSFNNKLESINLVGWTTNPNADFTEMFNECPNLISITAGTGFTVSDPNITMFRNDLKIVGVKGTTFITDRSLYARVDREGTPGYLSMVESDGIVSAKLYDSGTVSSQFTELTDIGSVPPDWDYYSGARLLEIKLFSMKDNAQKTLEITVPTGMYIVKDSWTKTGHGITRVDFTKNTNQGTGSYSNAQTGTLKYTINEATTSSTIQLLVMFDTAVWDKNKKDAVKFGTDSMTVDAPITVNFNNGSVIRKIGDIHSAECVGRSSNGIGYSFYSYNYNNNIFVDDATTLLASNHLLSSDQSSVPSFYKTVTYETYAEFKNTSNETVRADVEEGALPSYLSGRDSTGSDTKLYKGKWTNVYASSAFGFPRPKYTVKTSDNPRIGTNLTIYITVTLTTYSGQTNTISLTKNFTIKSKALDINDFIVSASNVSSPDETYYGDSGYAGMLGIFTMYNRGYNDLNSVKVVFEYDVNTAANMAPALKVMAARPFLENGQQSNATITLTNDNGVQKVVSGYTLKSTSTTDGAYVSAAAVAEFGGLTGTYYLKKIEYYIPKVSGINKTTNQINYLYHSQGAGSQTSGGNFMGKIVRQAASKCSVYYDDVLVKQVTSNSNVTATPGFSGYISSIRTPLGTEFTAGENIELDINVAGCSYPYTSTQAFSKPEVYLILPFGINIDSVIIGSTATTNTTEVIPSVTNIKTIRINDVLNNVYKITMQDNEELWFGYLDIKKTSPSGGPYTSKWFRIKLTTDISMEYTSFNLRDNVYFKDKNGHVAISGSYAQYSITDKYDVDDDGSFTDRYGTINKTDQIINIYSTDDSED